MSSSIQPYTEADAAMYRPLILKKLPHRILAIYCPMKLLLLNGANATTAKYVVAAYGSPRYHIGYAVAFE